MKIPDSLGDDEAPLACGGLTAYGAVKKLLDHHVLPGRPVAIIGAAGGLGHYAVQIASAFGYKVVGVDIGAERLDFVKSLGADIAVERRRGASTWCSEELGGVDASLVFSARMAGLPARLRPARAARAVRRASACRATSEGNLEFNPFELFMKDPTIIYSAVGTVQDMRELVDLAAAGKVKSHVSRTGAAVRAGRRSSTSSKASRYLGRAVLTDLSR